MFKKYDFQARGMTCNAIFLKFSIKKLRFNEKENITGIVQVKGTVIKQIRAKLVEDYPYIEEYLDDILPKKDNVRVIKW